ARRAKHTLQVDLRQLERVLRATSDEGDLVLDPFLGSGTTGVVAHALGRGFIGTEYSEANAKRSFERIEAGPIRLGANADAVTAIHAPRRRRPAITE
ncbi:MAG: DNA methyltransferase, partial [Planctomycetota bacterium]